VLPVPPLETWSNSPVIEVIDIGRALEIDVDSLVENVASSE
jgi:hypothetical protein